MAQYKVPQDVEAEDKLLGPFTFRQFVYLLIAAAGIAGAWGLFQLFPLLALIPLPFVFFFGILALPIRKDQPMETYLAALVSFYLKPNRRIWTAGQRESTIKITAPKKIEKSRIRDITEEEASHRLSFLATIVDTEGYAIRGDSAMKEEYAAEADTIEDVLDADNPVIDRIIEQEQTARKQELVAQMRTAINRADNLTNDQSAPAPAPQPINTMPLPQPQTFEPRPIQAPGANYNPAPMPEPATMPMPTPTPQPNIQQLTQASLNQAAINQQMQNLANNNTFTIQTIAQQANRITSAAMMPNNEAGLQAPTFEPMSMPLPHETEPGQLYKPIQDDNQKPANDRPDLYGPPTAIFS